MTQRYATGHPGDALNELMASSQEPGSLHDSGETQALISRARQYGKQGDFAHAVRLYRSAIDRLPEGDPQRQDLQEIVAILEGGSVHESAANPGPPELKPSLSSAPEPPSAEWHAPPRYEAPSLPDDQVPPQPAVPLWFWAAALVTLAVVCGAIIFGLYLTAQTRTPPIPRLSGLAPTAVPATPKRSASPGTRTTSPQEASRPPGVAPAPTIVHPASPTRPLTPTFVDNFNGTSLDPSRWIVDNSTGTTVQVSGNILHLASSQPYFPYIHSRADPFPATGNFRVDLLYRFTNTATCGVPLAMSSFYLPPGLSQDQTNARSKAAEEAGGVSIWFWNGVIYYRSGPVVENIDMPGTRTDARQVAIEYTGGRYHILVNGAAVYTSDPTSARPQVLWFGLPFVLPNACGWDSLDISSASVTPLP